MSIQTDWMVQVWEDGGFSDYWPVTILGKSRRRAVERAPNVFCGSYADRYQTRSLRWRVGRCLRTRVVVEKVT